MLAPLDIPPGTSGFAHRQGTLYLPPGFSDLASERLPVLVMLGGAPGGPQDWARGGYAAQTADAYATEHHGLAPILAFVDENGSATADTECVDGPGGQAETFLAVDVPRYLSGLLHVPLNPGQWGVGGFSEGDITELLDSLDSNYLGWASSIAPVIMGNPDRPDLTAELTASFCRTDPAITG